MRKIVYPELYFIAVGVTLYSNVYEYLTFRELCVIGCFKLTTASLVYVFVLPYVCK